MRARTAGPTLVLGAVVLGVLGAECAGPAGAVPAMALAGGATLAAAWCAASARGRLALALGLVASVAAGGAVMARALDGLAHSPLTGPVLRRADARADVTLTADPDATRFASHTLGRVDRADLSGGRTVGGGRIVVVEGSGDAAARLAVLHAGDRVRLRGYFRPLGPFEARSRWKHAVGGFVAHEVVDVWSPGSPLLWLANWLRARVLAGHRHVPEPQRALLAGFLLGDTVDLPPSVVEDFRAAGLSHLVAVSGQNVAFVLALAGPMLRRGPRLVRLGGGLAVLVVFAAMTRFEPSVLRASTMAACSMAAVAVGRPTAGLRTLTLAATVLLLADPFLVHSVGFQLSCAASAGIALLGPSVAALVPGPRPLAEAVGVTVGAQAAVAPLLLTVFGGVPLVSVPANLVVAPVAGPLTVLGLVGGVVGGIGSDLLGAVATFPAFLCASVVLRVAAWAAAVPAVLGPNSLVAALIAALIVVSIVALGAGAFAAWRRRRATWSRARPRPPRPRVAVPPR
ncbi:MAG: ComEC/Rec2 family competence protein [Actinomycetota bacterium]